jgi:hypothetical protein
VDVDHPVALAMDERRQLVHPAAIIEVVIVADRLHPLPSRGQQRLLHIADPFSRDEDVQVAHRTALRRRQPRRMEGRPLQQHDRHAQRRQRAPAHLRFPQRLHPRPLGVGAVHGEQPRHPLGHASFLQAMRQAPDQLLGAGRGDQGVPVARPRHGLRIAKRPDEQRRAHARPLQAQSISSAAASPSG